jgi:hypothetical protein
MSNVEVERQKVWRNERTKMELSSAFVSVAHLPSPRFAGNNLGQSLTEQAMRPALLHSQKPMSWRSWSAE